MNLFLSLCLEARVWPLLWLLSQYLSIRGAPVPYVTICFQDYELLVCSMSMALRTSHAGHTFVHAEIVHEMDLVLQELLMLGSLRVCASWDHLRGHFLGCGLGRYTRAVSSRIREGTLELAVTAADKVSNLREVRGWDPTCRSSSSSWASRPAGLWMTRVLGIGCLLAFLAIVMGTSGTLDDHRASNAAGVAAPSYTHKVLPLCKVDRLTCAGEHADVIDIC